MSDGAIAKKYAPPDFQVPTGQNVFVHQAFECCPYAGLITSKIHDFVELNGYTVVDEPADAAVHVINTCGYNETRSQRAFRAIETVREAAPDSALVVTGCLTKIAPNEVRGALEGVRRKAMLGPAQLDHLDTIFDHRLSTFEATPTAFQKDRYHVVDPRDGLYTIMVSTGCLGTCRFCAIRRATLRPQSMTLDEVLAKVHLAISEGHRDIFLASQDLSSWGHDLGLTIVDLMRALSELDEEVLFSGEAFEPTLFFEHIDALIPILKTGKFAWLVFPIQSGSQRILDLMRRTYQIDEVMEGIRRVKEADPSIITCTDVIYGYEESWDEFMQSVEMGRLFDYAKYNNYEPRPGTPPIKLSTEEMVKRRTYVMEELGRQGLEIDVLTAKRIKPYTGPREKGKHKVNDDLRRWLGEHEARFTRLIERKNGIDLGGIWTIREAKSDTVDLKGLVLTAYDQNDRKLGLVITRAGEPGVCMAISERFQAFLKQEDGQKELDDSQRAAVEAFVRLMGMKMIENVTPPELNEPAPPAAPLIQLKTRLPVVTVDVPEPDPETNEPAHRFRPSSVELETDGMAQALSKLAGAETAEARAWRGELLLWWGKPDEAQKELEAARAANPTLPHPVLGLAALALSREKWTEAMALVGDIKDSPRHLGLAGEAFREVGLWHDSREALLKAVEAHPAWVAAWINMALVEGERGRRAQMRQALERAAELAPGLMDDAMSDLGMKRLDRDSMADVTKLLNHVLRSMLRGNRDPEMCTWFTRDGRLRARYTQPS